MKKNLLLIVGTILFGVVIIVSNGNGQDKDKKKKNETKSKSMTIIINEDDTIINGKKFKDLSAEDKEKFLQLEKEMKAKMRLDREMVEYDKKMSKLNKEIFIFSDSLEKSFHFDSDDDRIIIRTPRPPKVPRHPGAFVEIPDLPGVPIMEGGTFSFNFDKSDDQAQVYVFNDGKKKTVIKLMKASPSDLKKIGAKLDEEIKMFPNPAKDQITLNFNFSESAPVTINLYDEEGKLVKTETIKDYKSGNYEKVYSMNDFEDGSYIVEFVQKNTKIVRKLFIRR